ncbi:MULTISPECIES: YtjB family periplasmic protein [unclassified Shewanella]|uniref:YtjB family periplasmic protein n=1 Tax=unclassified Shewanella TaxID=196818 RepID=UPI002002EFB8|nr:MULTISPECIES: AhpA/YtjB family protein [unclassified Shewanella]MCK7632803.1 AhpA/YtjB family protein [Shewanella sp. JNE17]MCK7647695.1 AhpA/YtjB family protein [Shewanella sp. JNE8]MCK7656108.1 AhpA/YtjB family protein [Shewanella sp. JNE4-2]UPO30260.1 AhpA/YtjB family protein [Shewanella sp. JNE2]
MLRVKVLYLKGLKKSHKISRLLQIAIALTLMVGLVQLWQTSLLQGQLLLKSQTQKMARLLVQQTAYGAAPALQLQNDEQLQWLASALVEDPKVMSAAIFSDQGIRLSFAQSITKDVLDPDSEEMVQLLSKYPPYVEPVLQEGKNLGYVEVRLDTKLFFNEIKEAHSLNMEQQQIMLLVAGLIGMLLSRSLSFKRADFDRRRFRVKLRQAPKKPKKRSSAEEPSESVNDGLAQELTEDKAVSTTDNPQEKAAKPTKAPKAVTETSVDKHTQASLQTKAEKTSEKLLTLEASREVENATNNAAQAAPVKVKPKVKSVRKVKHANKATTETSAPNELSDLDTDSTG